MRRFFAILALAFAVGTPVAKAGCFQAYQNDILNCSYIYSLDDRTLCNLDAAVALTACVRNAIF